MKNENPNETCRRILKESKSNFAPAFRILPQAKRDALTAFYAFCRLVDDGVDDAPDIQSARGCIQNWERRIEDMYRGKAEDPVSSALCQAISRFGIKQDHLELILKGVEQDLSVTRYPNFESLYEYCYHVASAVGFVCVEVMGDASPEVELYAELCGIGVQLTNIIRDVGDDASKDRIYLPLDELKTFGVDEDDILSGRMTSNLKKLLRFQARRAGHFYDMACAALPPSKRNRLFFPESLREIYSRLLKAIVHDDFPVLHTRVSVRKREKLAILLKHRIPIPSFNISGLGT
jgi:phytoene synthase